MPTVTGMSFFGDQVVEHRRHVVLRPGAVLEHHHRGGALRPVLRRDVDPPVALRAREDLALPRRHLLDRALRHAGLLPAVGMRLVRLELPAAQVTRAHFVVPGECGAVRELGDAGVDVGRADSRQRHHEEDRIGRDARSPAHSAPRALAPRRRTRRAGRQSSPPRLAPMPRRRRSRSESWSASCSASAAGRLGVERRLQRLRRQRCPVLRPDGAGAGRESNGREPCDR